MVMVSLNTFNELVIILEMEFVFYEVWNGFIFLI